MRAEALRTMVLFAAAEVPFYRGRLDAVVRDGRFDPKNWHEIPVLTRPQAQQNREQLFPKTLPQESIGFVEAETSGSTGTPFAHRMSGRLAQITMALTQRIYADHAIDGAQTLVDIRLFPPGAEAPHGKRGRNWHHAEPDSPILYLDANSSLEEQSDFLRRSGAAYLFTYPSSAFALAGLLEAENDTSLVLSAVFTIGGSLTPEMRTCIEEAFACPVIDMYGCQEAGLIATQCPESGLYHVCSESVLLEILREDGAPAAPGESGRVVLTSLHNFAMPLIRYEVGDYAAWAEQPCGCERALPALQRVDGRIGNLLVFPDNSRRLINFSIAEIRRAVDCVSYQIVQHAVDEIELRYLPAPDAKPPRPEIFEAYIHRVLNPAARVRLTELAGLERVDGKFEIVKSLVGT